MESNSERAPSAKKEQRLRLGQVGRIWWGTAWRYFVIRAVIGWVVGAVLAVVVLSAGEPISLPLSLSPLAAVVLVTLISALMMMVAIRQALEADYGTFSLTVLTGGQGEAPGLERERITFDRMVRIWWAAAWPVHLIGLAASLLIDGLSDSAAESWSVPPLAVLLLLALFLGFSFFSLRRALHKRYSGFRIGVLQPWFDQPIG